MVKTIGEYNAEVINEIITLADINAELTADSAFEHFCCLLYTSPSPRD